MIAKISRNSSHLSGEYFVAAELYRRGYEVGLTIGNAKSIDILAYNGNKQILVQVKTIQSKKSVGWNIMRENVKSNVVYIFVNLNHRESPEYFICNHKQTKNLISQYTNRGIINIGKIRNTIPVNNWEDLDNLIK